MDGWMDGAGRDRQETEIRGEFVASSSSPVLHLLCRRRRRRWSCLHRMAGCWCCMPVEWLTDCHDVSGWVGTRRSEGPESVASTR